MKITVKNFKQYPEYTLKLPDTGLVLLKGETGKGKTTLFEAAYDAITGLADDVVPWTGEKPVEVEFEFGAIRIKRTHNPETIFCEIEDSSGESVSYTGEQAQAKIYEYFTSQTSEFTAAYYIRQRMENSLLSFGPAQMLRFIQKMAFGDQDPEVYKQKIKTQIDARLVLKQQEEFKAAEASKHVNQLAARLESDKASLGEPPVAPSSQAELDAAKNTVAELSVKLTKLNKNIENLASDSVKKANADRARFSAEQAAFTAARKKRQERLDVISLELVPAIPDSLTLTEEAEMKSRISALNEKKKHIAWKKQVSEVTERIKLHYPEFKSQAVSFLEDKMNGLTESTKGTNVFIKNAKAALFEARLKTKAQKCPVCETTLEVSGGKIIEAEPCDINDQKEQVIRLEEELATFEGVVDCNNETLMALKVIHSQAVSLKNNARKDPEPSTAEDQIDIKIKEIEDRLMADYQSGLRYKSLMAEADRLENDHKDGVASMLGLSEAVSKANEEGIPTADEVNEQSQSMRNQITEALADLEKGRDIFNCHTRYMTVLETWSRMSKMVESREAELASKGEEAGAIVDNVRSLTEDWAASIRLKELSDSASISATEGIINAINQYAEKHISALFPHGGTSVKINSGSTTNKGEERSKLSLSVVHKGQVVGKSINPLSGGEKDRVKIAFQLALAEIYNAQFMMLDEPFAGIDIESTMEICLSLLKEFSGSRLVVMAQHGAPEGIFDQVIEL